MFNHFLKFRVATLGLVFFLGISLLLTGCAEFAGGLKKDLADSEDDSFKPDSARTSPAPTGSLIEAGGAKEKPSPTQTSLFGNSSPKPENPIEDEGAAPITSSNSPIYLPKSPRRYVEGGRTTREDFIDHSQEEGSLWASGGQTNYFFTKNRVRSHGDLITLILDDDLYRDVLAEVSRTLSYPEKEFELSVAQDNLKSKMIADRLKSRRDAVTTSSAAPEAAQGRSEPAANSSKASSVGVPAENPAKSAQNAEINESIRELEKNVPRARLTDIDISKSIELKLGDSLMGEILERYPNGNYKIRAVKKVTYKNGPPRLVSVVGIVKNSDIGEENESIHSARLYEYRVEVGH